MRKSINLSIYFTAFGLMLLAFNADASPLDSPGAFKALVCSACHGFGGDSPGSTVPILAGMSPAYFKKAIKDYAEGKRPSPEMEPYAKYVVEAGLDEIAAYFAEQKKQSTRIKSNPAAIRRGMAAAGQCTVCHNPQGEGEPEKGFPDLRGQPAGYLQAQMLLLKEEKRKLQDTTLADLKQKVLKRLSDRVIADLAAYYSSLK
ncbi:MAG: c-type cytochrome [Deltaproteobacteria bacterium]|nr:c-type cytochrome [Deltaproteobacteria bacterium]